MFSKILIANRGEIALRIIRACRELGIETVVVYSEADAGAQYLKLADESICIGPAGPAQSYLNIPRIISAAEIADVPVAAYQISGEYSMITAAAEQTRDERLDQPTQEHTEPEPTPDRDPAEQQPHGMDRPRREPGTSPQQPQPQAKTPKLMSSMRGE